MTKSIVDRVTPLEVTRDLVGYLERHVADEDAGVGPSSRLGDFIGESGKEGEFIKSTLIIFAGEYGVPMRKIIGGYEDGTINEMSIEDFAKYICDNSGGLMGNGA